MAAENGVKLGTETSADEWKSVNENEIKEEVDINIEDRSVQSGDNNDFQISPLDSLKQASYYVYYIFFMASVIFIKWPESFGLAMHVTFEFFILSMFREFSFNKIHECIHEFYFTCCCVFKIM